MLSSAISRAFGWISGNESPQNGQEQPSEPPLKESVTPSVTQAASPAIVEGQTGDGRQVLPVDNVQPQLQASEGENRQPSPFLHHPDDSLPEVRDITPKDVFTWPSVEPDFPTLKLVSRDVRPGFWMGRGLVSMWCWAYELHKAHCELVGPQADETEENAHDIYVELMKLREEYLAYLSMYNDEQEWLLSPPGDKEDLPVAEVNYRNMHVELLDILATCPARLYESCALHEDVVAAMGKPEPQLDDAERELSTLEVFFSESFIGRPCTRYCFNS